MEEEAFQDITGLRILVIDDEASVRDFMPRLLQGHEVDVAASGGEGLEMFLQKRHELVISDWVMTGMSGLDVAERIKQQSPQTVVVLMTGWEFKGTAVDESRAIDLVFSKPFDSEKLHRTLQQAVRLLEKAPRKNTEEHEKKPEPHGI